MRYPVFRTLRYPIVYMFRENGAVSQAKSEFKWSCKAFQTVKSVSIHILAKKGNSSLLNGKEKEDYGKCPKISNTLFQTFWPKFYIYAIVSLNIY